MKSNKKKKEHLDGIIYKYTDKINGKIYIGQTVNEKARIQQHKYYSSLENNKKGFHGAIKKYGWENFEYKVLFKIHCNNEQDLINTLNSKEIISIKYFNSYKFGYNMTRGGEGCLGVKVTEETKQKQSLVKKGRKLSEETKKKFSLLRRGENNAMYGKHHTEETRKRLSEKHKGKVISKETREKISKFQKGKIISKETLLKRSKALKGRIFSEEHKKKISQRRKGIPTWGREVVQFSLDGIFIKEYSSLSEAERQTGTDKEAIRSCCTRADRGVENARSTDYIWRYKSDWDGNNLKIDNLRKSYIIDVYTKDSQYLGTYSSFYKAVNSVGIKSISGIYSIYKKEKKKNTNSEKIVVEYKNFIWKIKEI